MLMTNIQNQDKKIPLSNRMRSILAMLQQETLSHGKIPCVADIGCDHAFVSMACVRNGLTEHVIAMDVRKGPLSIAQTHIQEYGFEKSVETRLSNGFEAMKPGEATWAVLAGMGGELMKNILQDGKSHLDAGIGLILQPQSELQTVRMYLQKGQYIIIELMYGPVLLRKENRVFQEYLIEEQHKMQELQKRLSMQDTAPAKRRLEELEEELLLLARAIAWNHG